MTKRKYAGALARRGRLIVRASRRGSVEKAAVQKAELLKYDLEGLALLCRHYRIDEPDPVVRHMWLALRLAYDHVPYFQAPGAKPGTKVDPTRFGRLEIDIAIERAKGARSERAALVALCARRRDWKGNDPDSLARELRAARRRGDLMQRMMAEVMVRLPQGWPAEKRIATLEDMRSNCSRSNSSSR